jgi:zinc protease
MLPGPDDITRRELSNGIVVLVRENHSAQSVVITGSINAGSIFEPDETLGLAAFTASSLMRGTEKRDFATIHELLESSGASLGISSGVHTVGFSGKSLAEDLPMLLELLADALRCPSFPERQIERLRGEIITSLKAHEQDTHYMAGRLFRELAYPVGHPYYRASEGRIDTISAITREQLWAYQQQVFGPKGMVLVIVGAIDTEAAFQLVQEQFGDWMSDTQPDGQSLPLIEPLDSIRSQTLVMPGKSQVDLVLGIAGPSRYAEDWEAASLGNSILGVFGMYGRIGAEVREKRGMAYYSFSRIDGGPGPGAWRVVAGVNPVNVQAALLAIRGEIDRITSELVTDDELADNKANFIGRLPLTLESNEGVAGTILAIERYNLGLDYLWHYADRVNAITAEAVLSAARHYLSPTAYALSIAGPEIELDTSLL